MAAAVLTLTPITGAGFIAGNKRVRYYTITSDTGDYAAGGFTLTAQQLGMAQRVYHFGVDGGVGTQGTAGASGVGIGVLYNSGNTSVTFQLYETGASSGAPLSEKNAEAMVANFTFRAGVEGR